MHDALSGRSLCVAVVACVLLGTAAFGQSSDRHVAATSEAPALYSHCTFAHGYIHGYEQGFHEGDIDIHMGRRERPLSQIKSYKDDKSAYRSEFGDRHYFKTGYERGFQAGYSDSIHGLEFRAVDQERRIGEGLRSNSGRADGHFDQAFAQGYDSGLSTRGQAPPIVEAQYEYGTNLCHSRLPQSKVNQQGDYCDAFARGFSLGSADAQADRANVRTETAKK